MFLWEEVVNSYHENSLRRLVENYKTSFVNMPKFDQIKFIKSFVENFSASLESGENLLQYLAIFRIFVQIFPQTLDPKNNLDFSLVFSSCHASIDRNEFSKSSLPLSILALIMGSGIGKNFIDFEHLVKILSTCIQNCVDNSPKNSSEIKTFSENLLITHQIVDILSSVGESDIKKLHPMRSSLKNSIFLLAESINPTTIENLHRYIISCSKLFNLISEIWLDYYIHLDPISISSNVMESSLSSLLYEALSKVLKYIWEGVTIHDCFHCSFNNGIRILYHLDNSESNVGSQSKTFQATLNDLFRQSLTTLKENLPNVDKASFFQDLLHARQIEATIGFLSCFYDEENLKLSCLPPSLVEVALINEEIDLLVDIQSNTISAFTQLRASKSKSISLLKELKLIYSDIRKGSIVFIYSLLISCPQWISSQPSKFWDISLKYFKSPTFFVPGFKSNPHDLKFNEKIFSFLTLSIKSVSKYKFADISDILSVLTDLSEQNFPYFWTTYAEDESGFYSALFQALDSPPKNLKFEEEEDEEEEPVLNAAEKILRWKYMVFRSIQSLLGCLYNNLKHLNDEFFFQRIVVDQTSSNQSISKKNLSIFQWPEDFLSRLLNVINKEYCLFCNEISKNVSDQQIEFVNILMASASKLLDNLSHWVTFNGMTIDPNHFESNLFEIKSNLQTRMLRLISSASFESFFDDEKNLFFLEMEVFQKMSFLIFLNSKDLGSSATVLSQYFKLIIQVFSKHLDTQYDSVQKKASIAYIQENDLVFIGLKENILAMMKSLLLLSTSVENGSLEDMESRISESFLRLFPHSNEQVVAYSTADHDSQIEELMRQLNKIGIPFK